MEFSVCFSHINRLRGVWVEFEEILEEVVCSFFPSSKDFIKNLRFLIVIITRSHSNGKIIGDISTNTLSSITVQGPEKCRIEFIERITWKIEEGMGADANNLPEVLGSTRKVELCIWINSSPHFRAALANDIKCKSLPNRNYFLRVRLATLVDKVRYLTGMLLECLLMPYKIIRS